MCPPCAETVSLGSPITRFTRSSMPGSLPSGRLEHHDVAAVHRVELVRQLVDEHAVVDLQRRDHRLGRDEERLEQERLDEQRDEQREDDEADPLRPRSRKPLPPFFGAVVSGGGTSAAPSSDVGSVTTGAVERPVRGRAPRPGRAAAPGHPLMRVRARTGQSVLLCSARVPAGRRQPPRDVRFRVRRLALRGRGAPGGVRATRVR